MREKGEREGCHELHNYGNEVLVCVPIYKEGREQRKGGRKK